MQLDEQTIRSLRERGQKSLFFLARGILGFSDLDVSIHKPICLTLQHPDNTRVIVVLPRTWFKSSISSIAYPIFRAINDPDIRILVAQSTYDNACKKLQAIASVFEKNALFRLLYNDILPTKQCRWSGECLEVNRTKAHPEGTFEAAGVGTTTTSRHYDVIIEDDTIAPKKDDMTGIVQQPTQLDIEKAIGWHSVCHPMLLHPTKSQIVVVGTRWAERDLIGYLMLNFPEYKIVSRAALEKDGKSASWDEGGRPVWSRFNEEAIHEIEHNEGPYMFAALYLNKPTAAINQVFKRNWIQYYEQPGKGCYACTSVDLAAADREESGNPDFNVVLTTGFDPQTGRVFVLEYTRERMNPSEVINSIFTHHNRYHPVKVIVEAIGYQRTLVHWLQKKQRKLGLIFSVEQVKSHKQSKVDRIRALQPYFSAGLISLKKEMISMEQELLAFPKGEHDDLIDALSMQVHFWTEMMGLARGEEREEKDPRKTFGGDVIKELTERFEAVGKYPYDQGNMDDRYFSDQPWMPEELKNRVRSRLEQSRVEALFV